jgi:hypothetical protein
MNWHLQRSSPQGNDESVDPSVVHGATALQALNPNGCIFVALKPHSGK